MQKLEELRPFAHISTDLSGPFPTTQAGNRFILVIVDHMTQYAIAIPLPHQDERSVSVALTEEVFYKYGYPDKLESDQASVFNSILKY